MAIISAAVAAIAAVGTAIGAGGVGLGAALAVAAVNVGTVVGVVGLGLSVVGMATGNESLSKIGGYLGMAGGAMGLVGGLAGGAAGAMKNISQAWDDGVGSLFSSTKPVGQVPLGQSGIQKVADARGPYTGQVGAKAVPGDGVIAAKPPAMQPPQPLNGNNPLGGRIGDPVMEGINPADMTKFAGSRPPTDALTGPTGPVGAPSSTANLESVTAAAKGSPVLGQPKMGLDSWPSYAPVSTGGAAVPSGGAAGFFNGLPDWAKAQMAISGAQGLAGMLGGWFESATAEEKLALERQAQEWKMAHEDKNQAFTQKNASYAPLVQFGGNGMINRGA